MKRGWVGLLVAVTLVGAVGPAAWAQGRGGVALRSRHHGRPFGGESRARDFMLQPYGRFGGPPAHAFDPPRIGRTSSGLIEQNLAIMRATSPNPRLFMGGQLNPRPLLPPRIFPDAVFFDPFFAGGVAAVPFGGVPVAPGAFFPSPYAFYGPGVSPYIPRERVIIIQREVVVPREQPRRDGDYYLAPRDEQRSGESLSDATADIRKAWLNGDIERLKARIRDEGKVRIYLRGKYRYSISAADFAQMSRDAMSRIDTLSFELEAPRTEDGRAFVAGKHVYRDADGDKREVNVSYVLQRDGGRWKIVEAGSGAEPVTKHED